MLNLSYKIGRLLSFFLDKKALSPTDSEFQLIEQLQMRFQSFSVLDIEDEASAEGIWASNVNRLRELVLNGNPLEFLRWKVILETMFVDLAPYVKKELNYLKHRPDWNSRWRNAIRESRIGRPPVYPFYSKSSGNLIHHAYHLAAFESKSRKNIGDLDFVLEFGGGYGSVCRLAHNLNFRGKYIIFDLPHFSALQEFYLRASGFPVICFEDFQKSRTGILCVSDIDELENLTNGCSQGNSLFIGTWSISEAPIQVRDSILPLAANLENILIAYQEKFKEIDNRKFFQDWKQSLDASITWYEWAIPHLPSSYYLIGQSVRRDVV